MQTTIVTHAKKLFVSLGCAPAYLQVEGMRVPLEVALLNAVRKLESVARLLDYFPRPDSHLLVLERSPGQLDLFDHLTEVGGLGEAAAREIFRQVMLVFDVISFSRDIYISTSQPRNIDLAVQAVVAVQDCHAAGVTHRDIKDENLLLCPRTGRITLIDFGSGAFIQVLQTCQRRISGLRLFSSGSEQHRV